MSANASRVRTYTKDEIIEIAKRGKRRETLTHAEIQALGMYVGLRLLQERIEVVVQ